MKFFYVFVFSFCAIYVQGQAGIYTEYDIDIQNKFLEAQVHKFKGDTEKQTASLREVLKIVPDCDIAMYELSRIFYAQEDQEQALKYATKAFETKQIEWYGINLADIYENQQRFDESEKIFAILSAQDPENLVFYHRLAFAQKLNGNIDEAIETFNRLEQKDGISEATTRRKFEIYSNTKRPKDAIKELKKLSDAYPKNIRYLNNLAGYYEEIGDKKNARKTYEAVLKLDPTNSTANIGLIKDPENTSDDKYLNAIAPLIENDDIPLDAKVKELIPYIKKMPLDPADPKNLALISNAEKLVTKYPNEAKSHALIADVYYNTNKREKAIIHYKKAIELNDNIYSIWEHCLKSLFESSDFNNLDKYATEAIDLFPNQFQSYFFKGLALAHSKNKTELDDLIDEAKFVAGKSIDNKIKLEVLYTYLSLNNGASANAMDNLKDFDITQGTLPYVSEIVGDAYALNNKIDKALQFWNSALQAGNRAMRLEEKIAQKKFVE